MRAHSSLRIQLTIAIVALLLFVPGLGAVHLFDWDEINFAEIAREMLATNDWLQPRIDYVPFYEKPPLFIWMQAASMSVFGVGEFAARLPNAICGIVTLLVLFRIGERLRGRTFGALWALAYVGSILPNLYFRSGIIDPWFNLFIFLGLNSLIRAAQEDHPPATGHGTRHALLSGLFFGLAVLTKGPVGILVPGLVAAVMWMRSGFRSLIRVRSLLMIAAALLITVSTWFVVDLIRNGPGFMVAFFWRQVAMLTTEDAGHGGFFGYHFVVLLIGCFPASLFAAQELWKPMRTTEPLHPVQRGEHRRWMVILFWVVLVLFSVVKTKIVHYSSLCYFPLTYLAALRLTRVWKENTGFGRVRYLIGPVGMVFVIAAIALPIVGTHIDMIKPLFAKDPFALANLEANVHWSGWEASAGILLLAVFGIGHFLYERARFRISLVTVFAGTALFVTLALYFFINRIEAYSQGAAITFFEERQGEKCYVITKDYKSYAHLFYARTPPVTDERAHDEEWLLHGDIDRPVYVVCKVTGTAEVAKIPGLTELYRRNGFVFFRREP
ncbi:MAG: glycosyltransferase family 39 protein [Flavobacteriales bacterium]